MKNESNNSMTATENTPRKSVPELATGMNMRRKLMFGLLGGLLMQTVVPLNALGAADKPAEDDVTEEMILEFLRNLNAVIQHDDLADIGFIERTLGVKAVWVRDRGVVAGRKMTGYILTEPKSKVFLDMPGYFSEYFVGQPLAGGATFVDVRISISKNKPQQPDINIKNMESIFGKPLTTETFPLFHDIVHPPIAYAYRYQNKNDIVIQFTFQRDTGALARINVFQNDKNRLEYFPLK